MVEENHDDLVKSRNSIEYVIPAKAGIQSFQGVLDPGFRRGDDPKDFLRDHQSSFIGFVINISAPVLSSFFLGFLFFFGFRVCLLQLTGSLLLYFTLLVHAQFLSSISQARAKSRRRRENPQANQQGPTCCQRWSIKTEGGQDLPFH